MVTAACPLPTFYVNAAGRAAEVAGRLPRDFFRISARATYNTAACRQAHVGGPGGCPVSGDSGRRTRRARGIFSREGTVVHALFCGAAFAALMVASCAAPRIRWARTPRHMAIRPPCRPPTIRIPVLSARPRPSEFIGITFFGIISSNIAYIRCVALYAAQRSTTQLSAAQGVAIFLRRESIDSRRSVEYQIHFPSVRQQQYVMAMAGANRDGG